LHAGKDTKLPSPGIILEMGPTMFPVSVKALKKLLCLGGEFRHNSRDGFEVIIYRKDQAISVSMKIPQYDNHRHHYIITNHCYYYSETSVLSHVEYYSKFYKDYLKLRDMRD
jgi:hypothetical protein